MTFGALGGFLRTPKNPPGYGPDCTVMANWSCKTLKKIWFFCAFFKKTMPYRKVFKILFWKFSSQQWSTFCVQFSRNIADGKSVKSCIACLIKKKQNFASLSSSCYCAGRGQPLTMNLECSRFHPNWFTFFGVISKRVEVIKTNRKEFPMFGWSIALSRKSRDFQVNEFCNFNCSTKHDICFLWFTNDRTFDKMLMYNMKKCKNRTAVRNTHLLRSQITQVPSWAALTSTLYGLHSCRQVTLSEWANRRSWWSNTWRCSSWQHTQTQLTIKHL